MVNFKESQYKFTDPIRYFKENDPYYWEIDNLPLKQLQENVLWLKDQIDVIPTTEEANTTTGVNRADFNELKPSANGTNNVVTVNAGRYTARINDAYDLTPLQKIVKLSTVIGESSKYQTEFGVSSLNPNSPQYNYVALLNSFLIDVNSDALNLNGLIERVTVWDNILYNLTSVQFVNGKPANANWPILEIAQNVKSFIQDQIPGSEPLASEFVKQFRGVARTAVVDVPEQLSIEIPSFNEDDFFIQTVDGNGNVTGRQPIVGASKRIDLLFIYSKPVDSTETTIQKWIGGTISTSGTPVKITKPILGLIKGAGVGGSYMSVNQSITPFVDNSTDYTSILPNISDELDPNNGFQSASLNIHGSFPSPDDLMNLAPMIQEKFESNDPRLIGQTILPIAYVVVRRDSSIGSNGAGIVRSSDIIDIRPFFRTAELTYGERSGICAATPSISLANPVATKYNIEKTTNDIISFVDQTYQRKANFDVPKILAAGYVFGGSTFGPERVTRPSQTISVGWDLSERVKSGFGSASILRHIDLGSFATIPYAFGAAHGVAGNAAYDPPYGGFGVGHGRNYEGQPFIWKKKITITNINEPISDFIVKADLYSCALKTGDGNHAQTGGGDEKERDIVESKHSGVFVVQDPYIPGSTSVSFTIIVVASLAYRFMGEIGFAADWPSDVTADTFSANQRILSLFIAKAFSGNDIRSSDKRLTPFIDCLHPSVSYTVTAIPANKTLYSSYDSDIGQSTIQSYY